MRRPVDLASLTPLESLILSQAVYELGASASSWQAIAKIINRHPLLERERRPKSFFTAATCSTLYDQMLSEAGVERTEENDAVHAGVNIKISQKYFDLRYEQVYRLIQEEEAKFKAISSEIEEIRAGKWDDRIKAELTGEEPEGSPPAAEEGTVEQPPSSPRREEEEEEHSEEDQDDQPQETAEDQDVDMEAAEAEPEDKAEAQDAEPTAAADEEHEEPLKEEGKESSGEDEPQQTVRRSTRRKSIASNAPPKTRSRRQQRQDTPGVEAEDAAGTPRTDEGNPPSSPFETPTRVRDGKRKASTVDTLDSGGRDNKRHRDGSELPDDSDHLESPAAHNTRSSRHTTTRASGGAGAVASSGKSSEEQAALKRFQNVITLVHSQISQHRNGTIFHNPIKPNEAPDYHEIVKRPMDLKTIKARIKDGVISNSLEFQRDVYLMFANAMMYNRPGSDVYTMAEDMMVDAEGEIQAFRRTEGILKAGQR